MALPTYKKGQEVWYVGRDGSKVEAKITSVDVAVRPTSYGVALRGSDHFRETESPRLRPRGPHVLPYEAGNAEKPNAAVPAAPAWPGEDGDEFGSFADASGTTQSDKAAWAEPPSASAQSPGENLTSYSQTVDWRTTMHRPHTAEAAFSPPKRTAPSGNAVPSSEQRRHTASSVFMPPSAEEAEDDEFGDFESVDVQPAAAPEDLTSRAGPIPLSIFGEEEEKDVPDDGAANLALGSIWTGSDDFLTLRHPAGPSAVPNGHAASMSQPPSAASTWGSQPILKPPEQLAEGLPAHADVGQYEMGGPAATQVQLSASHADASTGLHSNDYLFQPRDNGASFIQDAGLAFSAGQQHAAGAWQQAPLHAHLSPAEVPGSPAGLSDDFGDFEEGGIQPEEAFADMAEALPDASRSSPEAFGFPDLGSRFGNGLLRDLDTRETEAHVLPSEIDAPAPVADNNEDGEIPWYLDAESFSRAEEAVPAALDVGTTDDSYASGQEGSEIVPAVTPAVETAPRREAQEGAASVERTLEVRPNQPRTSRASAAEPLTPERPPRPSAELEFRTESVQRAPLHRYVEVWSELVQACAIELERGQRILNGVRAAAAIRSFLDSEDGAGFVRALGQLYLASRLLDASMRAHIDASQRPQRFDDGLGRCNAVWEAGEVSVGEAVRQVAPVIQQQSLKFRSRTNEPAGRPTALANGLCWHEGLCSICLLPLDELTELHVLPWKDDRPCLVMLANLWLHRVRREAPSLQLNSLD